MMTTVSCGDWRFRLRYAVAMMRENTDSSTTYEIKVHGQLDDQWRAWFDDLKVTPTEDGDTILSGAIVDQAALYGVLKRINNLGLRLISVNSRTKG
ncbi:MAG: hypothetical protein KDD84_07950 [Caldilineaceae bacterium]|nr:hypothetical protein [Caldilineaceae bacterium]